MVLHTETKPTQAQPAEAPAVETTPVENFAGNSNGSENQNTTNFFQNQFGGFGGKLDLIRQSLVKPLGGGSVNEKISKLHQFYTQVYAEKKITDPSIMDVNFIIAPPSRIGNLYGGIIVAIPVRTPKGIAVAAHLMIVESSLRPDKQNEVFNGISYSIHNTASNTVTAETVQAVASLTELTLKYKNAEVVDAGFSVIPEEIQLSDEVTLKTLLDNAAGAALTRLQLHTGDIENDIAFVLADAIRSNEISVYSNVEEHPQETTDIANQPIRSDFRIRTVVGENNTKNQAMSQAIEVGTVDVFCSPVYSQPPVEYTPAGPIQSTRSYFNQVIIRDIKTGPETRLTAANLFILMATAGLLTQNSLWRRAYVPNMHIAKGQLDLRDIGAFGYEVPQIHPQGRPELIDTKSAEFTPEAFERYMTSLFHDGLIYQVDVPDGHYLLTVLLAEANGSQGARNIISGVLNSLTNGRFAELYPATEPMFSNTDLRVINGYYLDSETNRPKSLDIFDHLSLLNMVNGDARSMREFETSFDASQSSALKLAIRTAMLEELTSNMKVRSYSTRLTINPRFMEALINALRSQKLFPEVNSKFARQQSYVRPTMDFFQRYAVNPNHIPNLFSGYGNQNAQWGAHAISQPYFNTFVR